MSKIQKTLNEKLEFYIYNNLMINDIDQTISITIESLIRAIKKYHGEHQYHVEYKEVKKYNKTNNQPRVNNQMINDKIKTFNIMNDYIKKLNNQKINIMKQTINENQNIIDMYKDTVSHLNNVINKAIKQRDKYIIENKLLEHNQHHIINIIKNN